MKKYCAAILFGLIGILLGPRPVVAATGIVSCETGQNCVVGEFLYDDSYLPLTTAACTMDSYYPNGTSFLANEPLNPTADGWYSYSFTASSNTGLYRAQICCYVDGQKMCLDKSFEVKQTSASSLSADSIASAVWGATRNNYKTSGSFGEALQNIVPSSSDIVSATWSYSDRSLTTFGDLISDIVDSVNGGWSDSEKARLARIDTKVSQTRLLMEQLVNKPVVETTTEEVVDVHAKITNFDTDLNQIFADVTYLNSSIGLARAQVELNASNFEKEAVSLWEAKVDSIDKEVASMEKATGWEEFSAMRSRIRAIGTYLPSINKDSKLAYRLRVVMTLTDQLSDLVGSTNDSKSSKTVFGKLAMIKEQNAILEKKNSAVSEVLNSWDKSSLSDKMVSLLQLTKDVSTLNKVPGIGNGLTMKLSVSEKDLKNRGYYLAGVLSANQKMLLSTKPVSKTWLELGSIVFKSLVTNPSKIISQRVTVNYYLPPEVKKDHILNIDQGLEVKYDNVKDQLYVNGEFELAPSETRTVAVRVDDIWVVNKQEIESLRNQAKTLVAPLEKTAFFAQGATLKSDIDASLDRVSLLTTNSETPEAKIKSYRESQIELNSAKNKMDKLKDLVAQAGSAGAMFGFVGGASAVSVWGLIIIFVAGFVFMTIYMKTLINKEQNVATPNRLVTPAIHHKRHYGIIAALVITLGAGIIAGFTLGKNNSTAVRPSVLGQETINSLNK